ncbi:hypothetical protein FD04_GL000202 [Secundilactobacillus odoratitofui DSM 19909 = JCM 15043]|uniref:HTH tetR-type domain-containing protein n=2 Tax=Secundilactobacillus odoratitofui TaxID=480930 RepID=A0A0R1M3L2_9LACO|nr:TetR/AcrR family transcriptional regulator [Secundilactobacillus odoratitofui]KRK98471.1 hypothetical protein FD04_GL000202 [Secundilactobacillus odoratitofui DSM 19909 = JCM 15043]
MGKAQERTRRQILTAFLDLLMNKPYDMISISAVAEASFVTRSTFYRYFPDKKSLLKAEIEETVDKTIPDQPLMVQFVRYVEVYWPVLRHLAPTRQSRADVHEILNNILWELIYQRVQESTIDDPVIDKIRSSKYPTIMNSAVAGMLMGILERYVAEGTEKVNKRQLETTVNELVKMFKIKTIKPAK